MTVTSETTTVDDFVPPEVPNQFSVCDENTANWIVRKIIAAREYKSHVKDWAEREMRRADREEEFFLFHFRNQLSAWARSQISKSGGRRKSVNLPAGTVGFRSVAASLVVDDEDVVITWARKDCPDAIVTTERLAKSAINDHFRSTGELPSGTHVEPAIERFYVGT